MKKYFCDICGEEIKEKRYKLRILFQLMHYEEKRKKQIYKSITTFNFPLDLCESCVSKIKVKIKKEKEKLIKSVKQVIL